LTILIAGFPKELPLKLRATYEVFIEKEWWGLHKKKVE